MRHGHEFLGEFRSEFRRRYHAVADQVIDEIGPHRTEHAEETYLDRRRLHGEGAEPVNAGMPHEIDQNLDAIGSDAASQRRQGQLSNFDKMFALGSDLFAEGAVVGRAERISKEFKTTP